jgi:phosphoglycerate kinase
MRTVKDIDISGKAVLFRVDFNVPLDSNQDITDDTRIRAALPSLKYALEQNAKLIICSHLGRPKGKIASEFSLSPAAKHLGSLLGKDVKLAPDCIGEQVKELISGMQNKDVLVLENLRFHSEEQKNEYEFAKNLASLCDVYVNDAFAVSHRAHASVVAITKFVSTAVAGLLLKTELDYLEKIMNHPQRPLVAVVGGAKISSKLGALENMLQNVDKVIIGGAMANTFLKSAGVEIGNSKLEQELVETAGALMKKAAGYGIKFYIPVDVVVADNFDSKAKIVPVQEIPKDQMALDIGPATSLLYSESLHDAKTIVWNGPMGAFEKEPFSKGTLDMAHSVANSEAMTVTGGGDTDAAIHISGEAGRISYISTGGGAFLSVLEGKTLPAVAALES